MRVTALHIGKPLRVRHRNGWAETSIFKWGVEHGVLVTRHGLDGERQADLRVHGGIDKAVYVYSSEDYAWWSEVGRLDVFPGLFGENLTIDGTTGASVHIGDRYRVGDEVLLEVTGPREPCYKLGIRLGDDKFPNLFRKVGLTGFYLRVLEPGVVTPGDDVILADRLDHYATVGLAHIALTGEPPDRDIVDRVLVAPGLAESVKAALVRRIDE